MIQQLIIIRTGSKALLLHLDHLGHTEHGCAVGNEQLVLGCGQRTVGDGLLGADVDVAVLIVPVHARHAGLECQGGLLFAERDLAAVRLDHLEGARRKAVTPLAYGAELVVTVGELIIADIA